MDTTTQHRKPLRVAIIGVPTDLHAIIARGAMGLGVEVVDPTISTGDEPVALTIEVGPSTAGNGNDEDAYSTGPLGQMAPPDLPEIQEYNEPRKLSYQEQQRRLPSFLRGKRRKR